MKIFCMTMFVLCLICCVLLSIGRYQAHTVSSDGDRLLFEQSLYMIGWAIAYGVNKK